MSDYPFYETKHYQLIDHLYDTQKDFIILGLCGKVGSGVSTAAKLLEQKFEDLQLPQHGLSELSPWDAHEYRILYTYAMRNWKCFHKIRTSALITRRILSTPPEAFVVFLTELSEHAKQKSVEVCASVQNYFNEEMNFDLSPYLGHYSELEQTPYRLLEKDILPEEIPLIGPFNTEMACHLDNAHTIHFTYESETHTCIFRNQDLSKMLDWYAERRQKKEGIHNPFWHLILKEYIYDFLPSAGARLWNSVAEVSSGLPTLAMQCLGNHLRLCRQPYLDGAAFQKDGYTCIAEDINLAIKVFRAYQLKLKELLKNRPSLERDVSVWTPRENSLPAPDDIRTVIVVDSIKNPYESMYLKERYNNYYLIGIYTEDTARRNRLRKCAHMIDADIDAIDMIEQNSELKKALRRYRTKDKHTPHILNNIFSELDDFGYLNELPYLSPFVMQNVSSCLDTADLLINNRTDNESRIYLKRTLMRYVCLIMNPAIVLPTTVERCMQVAYMAKLNSGCISRQVGAVLTDADFHLLSIGWNQQPEGQLPCSYRDLCELYHHWPPTDGYSDYENDGDEALQKEIEPQVAGLFDTESSPLADKGKLPCFCFKDYFNAIENDRNQVHTRALHAEETAFLNLGAHNPEVHGGILFTTSSPCELCSKKAMYLGISKIYYVEPYSGISYKHVMRAGAPDQRPELILFTGAVGAAYTKLYTPLLPHKDENEMWLGAKMDTRLMDNLHKRFSAAIHTETQRGSLPDDAEHE